MVLSEPITVLNKFIESELNRLESFIAVKSDRDLEMSKLNALFHEVLAENKI